MKLSPGPAAVAERFRDVFLSEESGTLEIRYGGDAFSILFDRGMVAGAAGGPPLSEFLLREGKLSSGALVAAKKARPGDQDPIPELIERGEITAESVAESAARLSFEIVERAFSGSPDSVEFHSAPVSTGESQGDILRTVDLFLYGVRGITRFDPIREALVSLDRKIALRANPAVPLERLTLQPIHGFLLSRLDGTLSFQEIASTLSPQDEEEAARFIFSLLLLGSVIFDPPLAPGPVRCETLLSDHLRDVAREESESAFIRDTYVALTNQNPYQMLGIPETADAAAIQAAYEERVRAISADRFLDRVREKMRSELKILETRLAEAYLALKAPGSTPEPNRLPAPDEELDYDTLSLRREVSKTQVAENLDEQEKLAEGYYYQAKKFFGQADYHNCIQYLTLAIRHSDQTARYHFLLGESQARNPDRRWQKMAEQSYLRASKLDPWNADYVVSLGQFYKRQGFITRARRQFERALELQPGHPKAKEELGSLR